MRLQDVFVRLAAGTLLIAACADPTPLAPERSTGGVQPPAPGAGGILGASYVDAYIVTLEVGRGLQPAGGRRLVTSQMVDVVERSGGSISREWPQIGRAQVRDLDPAEAEALAKVPGVKNVVRDVVLTWLPPVTHVEEVLLDQSELAAPAALDPTGAFFWNTFQWNMKVIQVDDAFGIETGDPAVDVAILDTGITPEHLDMQGKVDLARSRSMINTGASPLCPPRDMTDFRDFNFHGTHVASIVTSLNLGVASVAPDGNLVAIKVLSCVGSGSFGDIIDGILYAADLGVDVINMSLGVPGGVPDSKANKPLIDAVGDAIGVAIGENIVVVNSAGNDAMQLFPRNDDDEDGRVRILVPGQTHPDIVVVSATGPINQTNFDRLASYSNFGLGVIDVAAPGGDFISGNPLDFVIGVCSPTAIPGLSPNNLPFRCTFSSYVLVVGTSQAAPHASGVAALIDARRGGLADEEDIREQLERSADPVGPPATHGAGRVNAFKAVTTRTTTTELPR